ncbi:ralBP1-associated Eps domain-containing protein 2 isoform X2 [Ambystoma mexicanum]|uniref:ralBP1-associated Eps domain-containing protein 2 isoform X2 n=1 Tax=Ambystoma mexicanum TaxID=8296 RepID=UPI0037E86E8C
MEAAVPVLGPLPLSDSEQKCYSELFARCQAEGAGRGAVAGGSKVGELFRATQLPADTLHQITELCGAKRVGYFGPAQFYVALKLIAAAQSGFPVRIESIKNVFADADLPLPRFLPVKSDGEMRCGLPPQAPELHGLKEKNAFKRLEDGDSQESESPPLSPISSPPPSPTGYPRTRPTYGYSKPWSTIEQHQAVAYDTRQSAFQQEGPVAITHGAKPTNSQSSLNRSFSVEREVQDSSNNYFDDPWWITEEQREYYTNQFKSLQPDLNSFISGSVARNFFTKSKLPIPELSHIWELSDVDCDGALNLLEFCAAFHLIVARKNGYTLPETLPQTLLPELLPTVSPSPSLDCSLFDSYRESTPINQQTRDFNRTELETVCEDPVNSEPLILFDVETPATEPTSNEASPVKVAMKSDLSSDDQQVVKVCTTPKIIPKDFKTSQVLSVKTATPPESHTLKARPRSRSYSSTSIEDAVKKVEEPPTPPPRPQKTHSRASSLDLNKIFQQNSPGIRAGWLPPPALPPRPSASQQAPHHGPTTDPSVQLKTTLQQATYAEFNLQEQAEPVSVADLQPLPQVKRIPPQTEESSPSKKDSQLTQPPSKPIRRKFRQESQPLESKELSPSISLPSAIKSHAPVQKQPSKQKRAIQTAIGKNKEANAVLARLNSELQQQLKEVHQERITLETQLEQFRPVTVL